MARKTSEFHQIPVEPRYAEMTRPVVDAIEEIVRLADTLALGMLVLAINIFGDAVRDLLDPRLRTEA